jgi:asparagine synthase (glutamine-hydrolysing)
MGGIAGILNSDGSRIDPARLQAMLASIAHRGRGHRAGFLDAHAALTEICPVLLAREPLRPLLASPDRALWIAFDGEIHNTRELRRDLMARGHAFESTAPAEIALHAFQEFGEDCVRHFNGQWALAIWDSRQRRLFASRDRLGIRPFYYTTIGREFLFASEIKALCRHPGLTRAIDAIALDQIFTLQAALPPRTIIQNVFELPPGMSLYWSDGALSIFRHWQIDFAPDDSQDDAAARERLCDLLADAARLRLWTRSPVATFAGGGLDSLLTTALVGRASDAAPAPLAVTFDESDSDDFLPAGRAAKPGESQYTLHCSPADVGNVFPEVVQHAETPFLTTEPAAIFLLSQFARGLGHDVLFAGAGADELFGGCDIYREAALRRFWSRQPGSPSRLRLLELFFCGDQTGPGTRTPAYWHAFFHVRPEDRAHPLFSHLPRWEQTARLKTFFSDSLRAEIGDYDAREEKRLRLPAGYRHWEPLCQAQYLEVAHTLRARLSSQYDRMLAAHGVAGRFPFLDHRVIDFATRLPRQWKLRGFTGQEILRRIAPQLIPAPRARTPRKFSKTPVAESFFGTPESPLACDYVDELLSRERITDSGLFDPTAAERLVHKARKGQATSFKDQLALAGLLSTQLVVDQLVRATPRANVPASGVA